MLFVMYLRYITFITSNMRFANEYFFNLEISNFESWIFLN